MTTLDLTSIGPARECVCGSDLFRILASWSEDNTIAGYNAWMFCESCDAKLEAPMPGVNC